MWLLVVVAFLGLVAILGGALAGGIFTIVLIPLAVIAFVAALGYGYFGGAAERRASGEGRRDRPTAPPTAQQPSSVAPPSTPEQLADARRGNQ
jgi:hypothetical protein